MDSKEELVELSNLFAAEIPIILIETHEEPRLMALAQKMAHQADQALYTWSIANGLCRAQPKERVNGTNDLSDALKHIDTTLPMGYTSCVTPTLASRILCVCG